MNTCLDSGSFGRHVLCENLIGNSVHDTLAKIDSTSWSTKAVPGLRNHGSLLRFVCTHENQRFRSEGLQKLGLFWIFTLQWAFAKHLQKIFGIWPISQRRYSCLSKSGAAKIMETCLGLFFFPRVLQSHSPCRERHFALFKEVCGRGFASAVQYKFKNTCFFF